jgi:hypothetical protein
MTTQIVFSGKHKWRRKANRPDRASSVIDCTSRLPVLSKAQPNSGTVQTSPIPRRHGKMDGVRTTAVIAENARRTGLTILGHGRLLLPFGWAQGRF